MLAAKVCWLHMMALLPNCVANSFRLAVVSTCVGPFLWKAIRSTTRMPVSMFPLLAACSLLPIHVSNGAAIFVLMAILRIGVMSNPEVLIVTLHWARIAFWEPAGALVINFYVRGQRVFLKVRSS
jgi:hypothetical protein